MKGAHRHRVSATMDLKKSASRSVCILTRLRMAALVQVLSSSSARETVADVLLTNISCELSTVKALADIRAIRVVLISAPSISKR